MSLPTLNILFWNVCGAIGPDLVAQVAADKDVDFLALTELDLAQEEISQRLRERTGADYFPITEPVFRLQVWSRRPEFKISRVFTDAIRRFVMLRFDFEAEEYHLGFVHFVSKNSWRDQSQLLEAAAVADDIREIEKVRGHRRTILIGDFNMNPFEPGMVGAKGFHAAMAKSDARDGSRIVQAREYPFFYNPMWGHFGDRTPGPPGSFFYTNSEQVCYFWNLFDQCLIRPDVCRRFEEIVEVIDRIGDVSLLDRMGRPNHAGASDHLPLHIRLIRKSETT